MHPRPPHRFTLLALIVTAVALLAPASSSAAIPDVLGGDVTCAVQGDDVRFCGGTLSTSKAFDGVPIDVNVAFPPEPNAGPDGNYPLVMMFHGYGGSKIGLSSMHRWLDQGYATFSMTARGFHGSCGNNAAQTADPAGCAAGYIRLMDTRYEVRDAQEFAGRLVDEGLVNPQQIGATGGSYGGGMSMALGALNNRKMLPDGTLVPWTSPNGTPLRIAAAAPEIPWTDLAYALMPNGGTLDYVADAPYTGRYRRQEVLRRRPLPRGRRQRRVRPPGSRPRRRHHALVPAHERRRALRRPDHGGPPRRGHHPPLQLLHRRLDCAVADADLQRLDRRPLPCRRGPALLQPHPHRAPERGYLALLPRLRAHARPEQAGRHRPPARRRERVV